jgi:hypothetical protein
MKANGPRFAVERTKNRLAGYSHWGDCQTLSQAILVAAHWPFDLDDLGRWSKAEGHSREFRTFRKALSTRPTP